MHKNTCENHRNTKRTEALKDEFRIGGVEEQKEIKIFYDDKKIAFGDNFLSTPLTEKRFSVVSRHI